MPATGDAFGVVYFEVEPGQYLPTHTDSPEEVLYIVAGTGEAHVGDERGVVSAGDLAVIPSMVPHGIRNIGKGPATYHVIQWQSPGMLKK